MTSVSVIVPIYNVSKYLDECLKSITSQTLDDIEIICVNDGSTDNSIEIANNFANNDKRITIIDKPNGGYGSAMNAGIAAATGKYIGIVEPDDYIDEDMFASLLDIAMQTDDGYDLVKSAWVQFKDDGDKKVFDPYESIETETPIDVTENPTVLRPHPSIWSGIYKNSFLNEFDIKFKEVPGASWVDNPFFQETLYFARTPVFTSKHFYNYRVGQDASSSGLGDPHIAFNRLLEMLDFIDTHEERPNFRNSLFWRGSMYVLETLNSKSYPENAESVNALITEFFSRMPENLLSNGYFTEEELENILPFIDDSDVIPRSANPKVSIVVPCYNVGRYIVQCVKSLKEQTLKDIEVIFVDDGSSDFTRAKLFYSTMRDDRMRVVLQDNKGAGAARNTGMDLAKGEYITFLDSDDLYERTLAEDSYRRGKETNADLVIFGADFYYEKSKKFEDVSWLDLTVFPDKDTFVASEIEFQNVFKSTNGWTWDKLFKFSFIKENDIKFQEIRTHNDMVFTYTAFLLADPITVCNKKLIHQRKEHGSSLSQTGGKSWWCANEALSMLENVLKTRDLYKQYERDFKNYVVHICKYSVDNMHASTSLAKLYNAIKYEWFPQYALPEDPEYYWVWWEREFFEQVTKYSVDELILIELQKELTRNRKLEKEKRSLSKKLKTAKSDNRKLRDNLKKIKSSKTYKAAKKAARLFHK